MCSHIFDSTQLYAHVSRHRPILTSEAFMEALRDVQVVIDANYVRSIFENGIRNLHRRIESSLLSAGVSLDFMPSFDIISDENELIYQLEFGKPYGKYCSHGHKSLYIFFKGTNINPCTLPFLQTPMLDDSFIHPNQLLFGDSPIGSIFSATLRSFYRRLLRFFRLGNVNVET